MAACAAQPAAQNALEPAAPAPTAPIVEITPSAAPAAEASAPQPTVVTQAELANLYSFTGTVEVESADGTLPAYEGMRLYAGDFLRTGAGSTASLDLDQGRLLMMDADAELQFLEKDNGTLEVYLTKGAILNRISKGQMKPYTVRAANVTMGVLGTVFRVSIDDVTGVAVTDLYEGKKAAACSRLGQSLGKVWLRGSSSRLKGTLRSSSALTIAVFFFMMIPLVRRFDADYSTRRA